MSSSDLYLTSANAFNIDNSTLSCESRSVEDLAIQQQIQPAALGGKQRRACLKKERRKRKRQALAKLQCPTLDQPESEQEPDDYKEDEALRERLHQEWLEREQIAQEEFRLRKEKEEAVRKRKEEEEKRIREEWEERQKTEREAQEQKRQQKRDREIFTIETVKGQRISSSLEENETVQKLLDQVETQLVNGGSWKNPDAPVDYGTEKDKANCPFFLKTGACRFGDRCSRKHVHPLTSTTLMVRSMFVTYAMEQSRRDDYDTDASLEYSEEELQQQFLDFYDDVLSEFKNAGKVIQFKVSCNFEPHLRGNVYVQYETENQCNEAFRTFNGRWYAGRQLQCEFCPVTKWKTAICGLYDRQKCPKGKHCNFLHVFRNPTNEFWDADHDLHLSPDRSGGFSGRRRMTSQRGYSPEHSTYRRNDRRSRSREKYGQGRRRSRSRERRTRSRSRESRRYQQSQRRGRGPWNGRSRSRERQSSRSRGREAARHSGDRLKSSQTRSSRKSESELPEEETKNGSDKRKRRKSKSKSPCNGDVNTSSHHHKRSKKSKRKKKSKKKPKRKKNKWSSSSSSSDCVMESQNDEDTFKDEDKQNTLKSTENTEVSEPPTSLPDNTTQEEGDVSQLTAHTVSECDTATLLNECNV